MTVTVMSTVLADPNEKPSAIPILTYGTRTGRAGHLKKVHQDLKVPENLCHTDTKLEPELGEQVILRRSIRI